MEENVATSKKTFFDDSSDSDEFESSNMTPNSNQNFDQINPFLMTKPVTDYLFANIKNYNFQSWNNFFPNNNVKINKMLFNPEWNDFFYSDNMKILITKLEKDLTELLKKKSKTIVPPPELVFNIFNIVNPSNIKVIILGQDPYPGKMHAVGFSFSIPVGMNSTKSLNNVYDNLIKFNHIETNPTTGCLTGWVIQGCFMLNSTLTTFLGESNMHKKIYLEFSKKVLNYINEKCENCVFLTWGADAFNMCVDIDRNKHCVISSSHPSGFSYMNTFTGVLNGKKNTYPSFESTDHFGLANKYLKKKNKDEIIWDLIY